MASASGWAMPWWVPIGAPQTARSFAYAAAFSSARRPAPAATAAPMMRSGLRPSKTGPSPPPSPPIRRSSASSTSSKKSVHCLSGPMYGIGIGSRVKPGASTSTRHSEGSPSWPSGRRLRATTSTASACSTPEM